MTETTRGYGESPYLVNDYATGQIEVTYGMQALMINMNANLRTSLSANMVQTWDPVDYSAQVNERIRTDKHVGEQVRQVVRTARALGFSVNEHVRTQLARSIAVRQIIQTQRSYGMQAVHQGTLAHSTQASMVVYNATQLRMLMDFPSRGTAALAGDNWTATTSEAGDFSPNNLNTDILEQVYRSEAGGHVITNLVCDTGVPQGVIVDTIAILNHNLSRSAQVQVQTSTSPDFSPVTSSFNLVTTSKNIYWIAPSLPTTAHRYWRFVIQDPTNPAGYLQIGAIVFGSSLVFSKQEQFVSPITYGKRHFKDVIATEGHTNVSNDRALKSYLRLDFQMLDSMRGNVAKLEQVFDTARTSLKVLWIPTPKNPERYAIFGKLTDIPERSITDNEDQVLVDLSLEVDESL